MIFVTPDPTQPADSTNISAGASWIRALTSWIVNFLTVSFNMTDGTLKASAVPNGLPTPYGSAGTILQSTGPGVPPVWAVVGTVVLPGSVIDFAGALPAGYLECDGSTKAIATYPALAAVLGVTFGGDGITTFGLPDCRGRVSVGLGTGTATGATAWTLGRMDGEETHVLIEDEMPVHRHGVTNKAPFSGQHQNGVQAAGIYPVVTGFGNFETDDNGNDSPHNNIQPSIGLRKIIKI